MQFRIAVVGHRHWDAATTEALLTEVAHATQVDRGKLEARLAESSPWLVDLESPDDAETLRQRWEARHEGVHLTVFPLRTPIEPVPTPAGPWAEPTVLLAEVPTTSSAEVPTPSSAEVPTPSSAEVPTTSSAEVPGTSTTSSAEVPTTSSAAPAPLPSPRGAAPRPPVMLRPGRVLDMRIEAPPKRTSWLFVVFLIVGGLAVVQSWRDWYNERPAGELQGTPGPHCAESPGHYTLEVEGNPQRYERGDETGRCVGDPARNPMGCAPPALLNGVRTLALGLTAGLDLVLTLPSGAEATLEPGTYDVAGISDDAPMATSNKPMCGAWTGTITIDALTWRNRPRATAHARWDPQEVSVQWDLRCQHGQPAKFRGCWVYGAAGTP
ncbi:hypothetical protein L6V77_05030 [Myxococcota bacterium]|nr:hypothetical protein [Myxococcota bacterium]